jgi:hypothetical protein
MFHLRPLTLLLLRPPVPSRALCTSIALYPLYGTLFSQQPSALSTDLWSFYSLGPLYCPLSLQSSVPLHPYVPSTALCSTIQNSVPSIWPSVPLYNTLYLLGPLSPLRPYFPSTSPCPLYSPFSTLRSSIPSMALCPLTTALCHLHGPLYPPRPSVPSTLSVQQYKRDNPSCFAKWFVKSILSKFLNSRNLFHIFI